MPGTRPETTLLSPLDFEDRDALRAAGARGRDIRRLWGFSHSFGPYLRKHREFWNLSLRKAGERLGISHTYLAQFENGEIKTAPPRKLLARIAKVYGLDEREVEHEAGYRFEVPRRVAARLQEREERLFRALMLHEALRPAGFEEEHLAYFPPVLRKFVLEIAENAYLHAGGEGADPLAFEHLLEASLALDDAGQDDAGQEDADGLEDDEDQEEDNDE